MNLYTSIGNTVGTREGIDLAHRLAAWHDAMVVQQRRVPSHGPQCPSDCPHFDAESLWIEAQELYGERASELRFLQTHADAGARERSPHASEMRAHG